MYGTVFKMRPKAGKMNELMALAERERKERSTIPGFRGAHLLQEANGDVWTMVVFDDEESYRKNAAGPEQGKWFQLRRELIESDPEWHDGIITEETPW